MLGRRRQGDDDGVDAVEPHVPHQIVDRAQDGVAHAAPRQGGCVIVVDAQDARPTRGGIQAAQQPLGHGAGADDGDQLTQTAGTMPVLDLVVERDATRHDHGRTEGEPQGGPGSVGGGDRIEEEGGDEQRTQRQQPAEQRAADRGAEIAEVAKAIGAGEAQEVAGEQRAQQNDEAFETPVDGRAESRWIAAAPAPRMATMSRPAMKRQTTDSETVRPWRGGPASQSTIATSWSRSLPVGCSRSSALDLAKTPRFMRTLRRAVRPLNGRAIEMGAILHGTRGWCCDHAGTPFGVL